MFNPIYNSLALWFNILDNDMYKVFLLVQSLWSVIDRYITWKTSVFLHTLGKRICSIISSTINDFKRFYNAIDCTSEWRLCLNSLRLQHYLKERWYEGNLYVARFHERWFILHVTVLMVLGNWHMFSYTSEQDIMNGTSAGIWIYGLCSQTFSFLCESVSLFPPLL